NGGQPLLWVPEIPIWFSLAFIGATILVATVASLVKTRGGHAGEAVGDAIKREDADSTAGTRR
ncbi:MAG: TerC family protein, partial [Arthrobacter sp.]